MPSTPRLTVLGSSAGIPTERRMNTAIALWRGDDLHLFDAGEPTAYHLARRQVSPDALRAVFITHPHADHLAGLPMLIQWLQLTRRTRPLTVYVPREVRDALSEFLHAIYLLPEMLGFDLALRPVAEGKVHEEAGISVEARLNRHLERLAARAGEAGYPALGESFSYRVEVDGRRVFFSGDLADPREAVPHLDGVDLAVIELAHFTPEALGEALRGSGLSRLVATHIIHTLEPEEEGVIPRLRAAGYEGEVALARDGDEFEV